MIQALKGGFPVRRDDQGQGVKRREEQEEAENEIGPGRQGDDDVADGLDPFPREPGRHGVIQTV